MNKSGSQRAFLVTGASGFIGSQLVPALVQAYGSGSVTAMVNSVRHAREEPALRCFRQAGIAVLECDLLELSRLNPKPPRFDVVYHLAACAEPENPRGPFRV